jgi:WD repeat and SOF domain-containing protein 1
MKIRVINRTEEGFTRDRSLDPSNIYRNLNRNLHPFEKAIEYNRALKAAKLNRIFAKPFLLALQHADAVTCIAKNGKHLSSLVVGSADGEIRLWDVHSKFCYKKLLSHRRAINGLSITHEGESCVSCSTDTKVCLWKLPFYCKGFESDTMNQSPIATFYGEFSFNDIDHHKSEPRFVTASNAVEIWEHSRQKPVQSFHWGSDSKISARFNPIEREVLAASALDCSLVLYDLRMSTPIKKLYMRTRTNAIAWNPLEVFNFTTANDDSNLYSFDMRKLESAVCLHQDFVSSVTDLDYSPTGREFVAGSYDRTIRIFPFNRGLSRDVYHTKRMQHVSSVSFSKDGDYIFSGSDDMNVRVWKADSSKLQGFLMNSERLKQAYDNALINRYQYLPELKKIVKKRFLPKHILTTIKLKKTVEKRQRIKMKNIIAHSAPCSVQYRANRIQKIIKPP